MLLPFSALASLSPQLNPFPVPPTLHPSIVLTLFLTPLSHLHQSISSSLLVSFLCVCPPLFSPLLITTHSQRTFMTVFLLSFFQCSFLFSVCWFSILHLYWSSDINGIHHDFFSYHLHNRCACACSQPPELVFFGSVSMSRNLKGTKT